MEEGQIDYDQIIKNVFFLGYILFITLPLW